MGGGPHIPSGRTGIIVVVSILRTSQAVPVLPVPPKAVAMQTSSEDLGSVVEEVEAAWDSGWEWDWDWDRARTSSVNL